MTPEAGLQIYAEPGADSSGQEEPQESHGWMKLAICRPPDVTSR